VIATLWWGGESAAPAPVLEAGTVLVAGFDPGLQRYVLTERIDGGLHPPSRGLPVRGLCLDADRKPWARGAWLDAVWFQTPREWAKGPERVDVAGGPRAGFVDGRRLVALRAVLGSPFEEARKDPRYAPPPVADADDVVRQWAVWRVTDGKSRHDVSAAVERETPSAPPAQREAIVETIWTATTVVLETGGKAAASLEGFDWAALDLTKK
jgi:hypothetical protein